MCISTFRICAIFLKIQSFPLPTCLILKDIIEFLHLLLFQINNFEFAFFQPIVFNSLVPMLFTSFIFIIVMSLFELIFISDILF